MSASRAGRKAEPELLSFFDGDEALDDLAALHQKRVHGLVDPVDLLAQTGERRFVLVRFFHVVSRRQFRLIGVGRREIKENIDSAPRRPIYPPLTVVK